MTSIEEVEERAAQVFTLAKMFAGIPLEPRLANRLPGLEEAQESVKKTMEELIEDQEQWWEERKTAEKSVVFTIGKKYKEEAAYEETYERLTRIQNMSMRIESRIH